MNQNLKELERTIANFYLVGKNSSFKPIVNAINDGLKNDIELLIPFIPSTDLNELIGNPNELKEGQVLTSHKPISFSFCHLKSTEDENKYYIPLFTSPKRLEKGPSVSTINQPLKELFKVLDKWPNCLGYVINPYEQSIVLTKEIIKDIIKEPLRSHLELIKGNIVDLKATAIVNAANKSLLGGGGVDGAIHKKAGPKLLEACQKLNGFETGNAKITEAYNLSDIDYIIHTVGPRYHGKKEDAILLSNCYTNSLDLALSNNCKSIVFPCISTGAYGYPLKDASIIALNSITSWLDKHQNIAINIYICCYSNEAYDVCHKLMYR